MTHLNLHIFILSSMLWLAGCAHLSSPSSTPRAQPPSLSWQARSTQLADIQAWTVHGSASIHQANKTELASLQWQQQHQYYQLALMGPLGFGRVSVIGAPGSITLNQPNKPPVSAATPERLLQRQLGWYIPVSNLHYWVRGLPAPGATAKKTFDAHHRLLTLEQDQWRIDYAQYGGATGIDLPEKMFLSTQNLTIKLVLRNWLIKEPGNHP